MQRTIETCAAALVQLGRSGCKGLGLMWVNGTGEEEHGRGWTGPDTRPIGTQPRGGKGKEEEDLEGLGERQNWQDGK